MQGLFSENVYAVAMKLHILIQDHLMTLYAKSNNLIAFRLNCAPFWTLEFRLNLCVQVLFSDTVYAVALKLRCNEVIQKKHNKWQVLTRIHRWPLYSEH